MSNRKQQLLNPIQVTTNEGSGHYGMFNKYFLYSSFILKTNHILGNNCMGFRSDTHHINSNLFGSSYVVCSR